MPIAPGRPIPWQALPGLGETDAGSPAERLPPGTRVYAVGDIHGRFDCLRDLMAQIACDLRSAPVQRSVEIFLGDYIDRGPQSRSVVDWLISSPSICDERHCLMGNHETLLLDALADPGRLEHWLANGGFGTLLSYADRETLSPKGVSLERLWSVLRTSIPEGHTSFLASLPRMVGYGGYAFVHAGVRPGISLLEQDPEDLVWIREPFLSSSADFGCVVVHGHTPGRAPDLRANRINVDTAAFSTGRLTAAVLEGNDIRFLQTDLD